MSERIIEFNLAGTSFTFRADLPEEEIEAILEYLERKKQGLEGQKKLSPLKQAVLMLLEVTADLVRVKKENRLLSEKIGREALRLSKTIDRRLECLGCA